MKILPFTTAIAALVGCANFNTSVDETRPDGTQKHTDMHVTTFFGGKSELAKGSSGQTDKSQRIGVGSINQEASATNLVKILQAAAILAAP